MPNKTYAKEWLEIASHHLESAKILYEKAHYTDIIGIELHQAIEKTLKAIPAYLNKKIDKTHELSILLDNTKDNIKIDYIYYDLCDIASEYYKENRYPTPRYILPEITEIKEIMDMAIDLHEKVCDFVSKP